MSPGINQGILRLCEAGVVRGVSLLANLEHLEHGLDELLRFGRLRFGVHLNFTYGPPLSRPEEVASLCGPDGGFHGLPALLKNAVFSRLRAEELRLEGRRQIRRLKRLGVPLTGLEGHHHVHLIPRVFSALAPALREERIERVRLPCDRSHPASWLSGLIFRRWFLSMAVPARSRGFSLQPALYLRRSDLRTVETLEKKISARGGLPVIVHPALKNDLARMKYFDPCREDRVLQFHKLLELSRRARPGGGYG
jgi:predicted glycoside hydrolase/deacetylase ChbG (UPF0249 family)